MAINIAKYDVRLVKEEGNRYTLEKIIKTPENARQVFVEVLEMECRAQEIFSILTLDIKSNLTGIFEVSVGGLHSSIVHPRNVFQRAILQNAAVIVLGHNHPSGDPQPSNDDIKITKKLISAGEILGIEVMDHIVVGDGNNFISMKEKGLI